MGRKRPFTPEEDAIIIRRIGKTPSCEIAKDLPGRTVQVVRSRVNLLVKRGRIGLVCRRWATWTDEDDANLLAYTRSMSLVEAADTLGRTFTACRNRLLVLGASGSLARQGRGQLLSREEVATVFGTTGTRVRRWMMDGSLGHRRIARRVDYYYSSETDLYRFIREHPDRYEVAAMPVGKFRGYAERQGKPPVDNSLTAKAVARAKGCHVTTVMRACKAGKLRAERRPGFGQQWFIDPASVAGWEPSPVPDSLSPERKAA